MALRHRKERRRGESMLIELDVRHEMTSCFLSEL